MKKLKKDYTEYQTYRTMIYSCYPSKNTTTFYSDKNIKVCDRWLGPDGFWNFLSDLGEKPSDEYRIGRKDTTKNFSPENCYWTKEKPTNLRKQILITLWGKTKKLSDWCDQLGINYSTAYRRYKRGHHPELILSDFKILLKYKDKDYTVSEVSEMCGLKKETIYFRLNSGWSDSDIIETPVGEIPVSQRTEENVGYGRFSYFLAPYFEKHKEK